MIMAQQVYGTKVSAASPDFSRCVKIYLLPYILPLCHCEEPALAGDVAIPASISSTILRFSDEGALRLRIINSEYLKLFEFQKQKNPSYKGLLLKLPIS